MARVMDVNTIGTITSCSGADEQLAQDIKKSQFSRACGCDILERDTVPMVFQTASWPELLRFSLNIISRRPAARTADERNSHSSGK